MRLDPLLPRAWPVTLRVPVLVAVLMVVVGAVFSSVVLVRLSQIQENDLRALSGTYFDGLSTAVTPFIIRDDIWEVFDNLRRARSRYADVDARYAIVARPDGSVMAASDPRTFPVQSAVPESLIRRFRGGEMLVIDESLDRAWAYRALDYQGRHIASIYAEIDISRILADRREILVTLVLTIGGLTVLFAAMGYIMVRRMVRPVSLLSAYVERARGGKIEPIPAEHLADQGTEFGLLFRRFNAMARALNEREVLAARLAEEEKLAQLGKLASGMAHEVNNPLGGLITAVNTMRKHGNDPHVLETSLDLLTRGLANIRDVVRAMLVSYKGVAEPTRLSRDDFDDLKFLVQHEVRRRRIRLAWHNHLLEEFPVDGASVRQAVLNLVLNACAASPVGGAVVVEARLEEEGLRITITDHGPGLPEPVAALFREPNTEALPEKTSVGLGTWTAARLVVRMNGRFDVDTHPSKGTRLAIVVPFATGERLDAVA